jgi:hypothetical protein
MGMPQHRTKVQTNKSVDKERRIPCGTCNRDTRHVVVASIDVDDDDEGVLYWFQYQILKCKGCDAISFLSDWQSTDDVGFDGTELVHHEEVFPPRLAGRLPIADVHFLPFEIQGIYRETHQALCSRQPILAGVGIRALIEAVCKNQGAAGSDLKQRIDALVTNGVLTLGEAEILHSLRIMGNTSAHQVQPHRENELGTAFDIVEHLLNAVYLLKTRAAGLPGRKNKSPSDPFE